MILALILHAAVVTGELEQWHAVSVTFDGPASSETATPNPFTDFRLDVTFTGPFGRSYKVPGYYAADGNAGETSATSGNKWRAVFRPDVAGAWTYAASFVAGPGIAAQPEGGASAGFFDGESGGFVVAPANVPGKLEYVEEHYLRFRGGRYFLKSGSNIPETLLEYADFDGTPANLDYATHIADWQPGDPTWAGGRGKGLIGALNYLSGLGINSMYFVTMNSHGDGQKSWPWTGPDSYYVYDCSKLDQWDVVFSHMDTLGMMLHVVLTETENESYFEQAELGTSGMGFAPSRKIYYRELIARFGHHLAITWNLGEENGWTEATGYARGNTTEQRKAFADYIRLLATYRDNITVHNGPASTDAIFTPLLGHASLTGNEIQWTQGASVHDRVVAWRNQSRDAGHPWVVSLDEPWTETTLMGEFRRWDVWGSYLAGAGGCEYFQTNDETFDDFRLKESFYTTLVRARTFLEANVPFPRMDSADALLSGASGYVFAEPGEIYVVFLSAGGSASLDLTGVTGSFPVRWFDPRNGGALQNGSVTSVSGGGVRALGAPPSEPTLDWVALVGSAAPAPGEASAAEPMRVTAYAKATGDITVSYSTACAATSHAIVHGPLSAVASYAYAGEVCGLGSSGTATFDPGTGSVFWVVVGSTPAFEGSYGKASSGAERPESAGLAACDLPQDLTGACP